ncbi:centrosomal protein of 78 kDa isoform X1 [Anguilla anguilla]|uniref:centrosomal protein of 78 kDa isoform X1 n=1 Tax=Anguilla anguilla TaxID=7936 RepID=UPI0015B2977C|nr:centrosomal protein of 78 kDa isoform X1 [Anguilla anguilla]XP_035234529.1 centrosomal protein of 78 kDa isoform X1 [Anguilla anguilla]XP_035234530.1 centrosomal protein of 78 kDa isoform X1 [Anguilla anguilla]
MLDPIQIRRRGAVDFGTYYDYACAAQDMIPVQVVKAHVSQGVLDFNGDRIRLADWSPILNSVAINKQLHSIVIGSCYQPGLGEPERSRVYNRKKIPAFRSKDMTFRLCKAIRDCLSISPCLRTLRLHGLPLRERDLIALTKGLAKCSSLENLSLAYCPIGDEGLQTICQSVKYSTSIKTVDFTGCNLTWQGAEHMANIIKHQATRRRSDVWAESLRYRKPDLEHMGGIRRITLNCNTLIGDRGAAALSQELAEDLWVKAVDLQKCGISNEGAQALLETLSTNNTLTVLDLRRNPLVDNNLVKTIIEKVLTNSKGNSAEYSWIKPPAHKESQKARGQKGARGKSTFRIGARRAPSGGGRSPCTLQPQSRLAGAIPWRSAGRAGRTRALTEGVADHSFQEAASVKITVEMESESEESRTHTPPVLSPREAITVRQYKRLQVELEEYRLRLTEERKARVRADARLAEVELENARLRAANASLSEALQGQAVASALEDDAVLESIETSFHKFHAFLDLLKDAGLGQLASMAGLDQSQLQPPGRPQFSSTLGPNAGRDSKLAVREELPAPPVHQPGGSTGGAVTSPVDFLPERAAQEVSVSPLGGSVGSGRHSSGSGGRPAEEWGALRDPPPPEPTARSGDGEDSRGNGSHGNGSHDNDSHSNGSRRDSPSVRGGLRGSGAGRSGSESEPLEQIHSLSSLEPSSDLGF